MDIVLILLTDLTLMAFTGHCLKTREPSSVSDGTVMGSHLCQC